MPFSTHSILITAEKLFSMILSENLVNCLSDRKENQMSDPTELKVHPSADQVRSAVLHANSSNPAVQRLQGRLLEKSAPSEVITSYDRMHHRHSRS